MKKYRNKNIRRAIALSLIGLLSISSCKEFTELAPINSLSETTAFSSISNVELAMAGVYNRAAVGNYNNGGGRGYPFGAASFQQSEMRGEDMVNLATFFQFTYESTITSTTANNVNMWEQLYALINQCNVLIEGVSAAVSSGLLSTEIGNQYIAEARFLRALAHHELVLDFCRPYVDGNGNKLGVPYRTASVTSAAAVDANKALDRGTVAQVYTKILEDLDFAEANSLAVRVTNKISRVTKGAAIALKTRVKLHMNDFAGVIAEGTKLGTSGTGPTYTSPIGNYTLTSSPDGPFVSNGNNTESLFSIENSSAANGGVNGALPNMFGPAANSINTQVARGLVATSPNLFNAAFWVTGDRRRILLQIQQSTNGARYYFNYKYRDASTSTDWSPIIRYAEVLLNTAEAYSRTTPLDPRALSLLNAVRNRSVPIANVYTIANFTSQNTLTQAILDERRVEFAGEGRRWPDITRLSQSSFAVVGGGVPAKVLVGSLSGTGNNYDTTLRPTTPTTKAALPYTDDKYIWPIPISEINANPVLKNQQNPGY